MNITRITLIVAICNLVPACAEPLEAPVTKDWGPVSIGGSFDTNVLHADGWSLVSGGAWADSPPAELVIDAPQLAGCAGVEFSAAAAATGRLSISLVDGNREIAVLDGYGPKLEELRVAAESVLVKPVVVARLDGQDGDIAVAKAMDWEVLAECP